MAQRSDLEFLTRSSGVDNSWLTKKQDTNVGYSVLAEYYKRQAALKAAATVRPQWSWQGTYQPTTAPKRPAFQNNGMVPKQTGLRQPAPVNPKPQFIGPLDNNAEIGPPKIKQTSPAVPRFVPQPSWDYFNWYRGMISNYPQVQGTPTWLTQGNVAPSGMGDLRRWETSPYQYLSPAGYSNIPYGPPKYLSPMNTGSQIYKGNKVPIGMQRYEEIASGRASPEMLLYGSANRWTEHLPPPPTSDGGSGSGSGGGGYYTGYPSYSGGGGGGGYGSYTPQPSRWWTDNAIWRI